MRLIDADALKYELGDTRDGEPIFRPTEFVRMDVIEKAIDEAPTIERPHGEWIGRRFYDIHCSVCGKENSDMDDRKTPFCMWCGASMVKEGDQK